MNLSMIWKVIGRKSIRKRIEITELIEGWRTGDMLSCRFLASLVNSYAAVTFCVLVLKLCRDNAGCTVPAVENVLSIGHKQARWPEGHQGFDEVRNIILEAERGQKKMTKKELNLLNVAEQASTLIYNATLPKDPFDDDSLASFLLVFSRFAAGCKHGDELFSTVSSMYQREIDTHSRWSS